jgi:hypothetical protein
MPSDANMMLHFCRQIPVENVEKTRSPPPPVKIPFWICGESLPGMFSRASRRWHFGNQPSITATASTLVLGGS